MVRHIQSFGNVACGSSRFKKCTLMFDIGNKSFTRDFLLLESCALPIILGTDFVTKNGCLINMQTREFCCEPSRPTVSSCINTISFHINDKLHLHEKHILRNMLATELIDCFARCENDRGRCNLVQHYIELQDNRPIEDRPYRQPQLVHNLHYCRFSQL